MLRPWKIFATCGAVAIVIAHAAVHAVEPSPLLLPYGANPLTLGRLKATFGNALRATSFGCAPGAVEADGRKCESWVVEKDVVLLVEFDYVRYRIRAADSIVDSMELVKAGDCDEVIAAYISLGDGVHLSTYWEPVTPQHPNLVTYRLKTPSPYLKANTIELTLRERRCSLSYLFVRSSDG